MTVAVEVLEDPENPPNEIRELPLPEELPPPADCFVLGYVSSRGARDLIRSALKRRGHSEGRDFLMCA